MNKPLGSSQLASRPYNFVPSKGRLSLEKEKEPVDPRLGRSSAECSFDDFAARKELQLEAALRSQRQLGELASSPVGPPVSSYRFASRETRDLLKAGLLQLDQAVVIDAYLEWRERASIVELKDLTNGERVARLAPKRGNIAYSKRMARKQNDILASLDRLQWDSPAVTSRPGQYFDTLLLLITLTYDPSLMSCQESWASMSKDWHQAKVELSRTLGRTVDYVDKLGRRRSRRERASVRFVLSKEGTRSGYAAPHSFIMLDRPVRAYRHLGKDGKVTYRLQSGKLLESIRKCWPNGFVDVQGIVSGGENEQHDGARDAIRYSFKYMAKSYSMDPAERGSKASQIARNTFAYQKLFALHPINISRSFKNCLNPRRLDYMGLKSQQPNDSYWVFERSHPCGLRDYVSYISDLNLRWSSETPFSVRKRGLPANGRRVG